MQYEILVDRTERPVKCSILPLHYRGDFRIIRFDRRREIPALAGNLLLHPDGTPLSEHRARGAARAPMLSAIDCNWRRLAVITARIAPPLPDLVSIPDGFQTAYRRRNQRDLDPPAGLATIEALFIAAAFLGIWDETLLCEYRPAREFMEINSAAFRRYGLSPLPSS